MSANWTTVFQPCWLDDPEFKSWIRRVDNKPKNAYCVLCCTEFSLSNMGKQALRSHMKSQKHTKRVAVGKNSLLNYIPSSQQNLVATGSANEPSSAPSTSNQQVSSGPSERAQLDQYVFRNEVTEAVILWCIETVVSHKSLRAAERDISVMKRMFHDSEIATYNVKRTKLGAL